jgi:DNA-directed RNA polymerase subunit RPC12/RpoP
MEINIIGNQPEIICPYCGNTWIPIENFRYAIAVCTECDKPYIAKATRFDTFTLTDEEYLSRIKKEVVNGN